MKFETKHDADNISLEDYERLFFDGTFNDALCERVKLKREVEEESDDGTTYKRVAKVYPDRELPGPLKKVIPADQFSYHEHVTYQWGSHVAHWKVILPAVIADKVTKSEGTYTFKQNGSGVSRVVEGEIVVKIFGIGKMVEKFLADQIESSYDDAAAFTQEWISSGRHTAV